MLIKRSTEGCEDRLVRVAGRSDGASSHLPGFDFVLVVILKDAFIAQTQPPWDPLLVLKNTRAKTNKKKVVHACGICVGLTNGFKLQHINNSKLPAFRSRVNKMCVVRV